MWQAVRESGGGEGILVAVREARGGGVTSLVDARIHRKKYPSKDVVLIQRINNFY